MDRPRHPTEQELQAHACVRDAEPVYHVRAGSHDVDGCSFRHADRRGSNAQRRATVTSRNFRTRVRAAPANRRPRATGIPQARPRPTAESARRAPRAPRRKRGRATPRRCESDIGAVVVALVGRVFHEHGSIIGPVPPKRRGGESSRCFPAGSATEGRKACGQTVAGEVRCCRAGGAYPRYLARRALAARYGQVR